MNNLQNTKEELLTFILSRIGLTQSDVEWLKLNCISFGKDPIFIRKYLMEDLKMPCTFLKELSILGMSKEEIFEVLNLDSNKIKNLIEIYNFQLTPKYVQSFIPETNEYKYIIDPQYSEENQMWKLLEASYVIPYNNLSYYDSNKELRTKIMIKLREKNIDIEKISDLFNYSLRMTREVIKDHENRNCIKER